MASRNEPPLSEHAIHFGRFKERFARNENRYIVFLSILLSRLTNIAENIVTTGQGMAMAIAVGASVCIPSPSPLLPLPLSPFPHPLPPLSSHFLISRSPALTFPSALTLPNHQKKRAGNLKV